MSSPEQATITDETIALSFRHAHQTLHDAAVATVREEGGIPAGEPAALVRFSGETHDIAIRVGEADLARRGLWRRRHSSVSVDAYATVTDHTEPDQQPIELWLHAIRSGKRHLLDPTLTGSFVTPIDMGGNWPKGAMASRLEHTNRIAAHHIQKPPVTSMQLLKSTVDTFISADPAKFTRSVEGIGEAGANIEFAGTEKQRAEEIITPFIKTTLARHSQKLEIDVMRMVAEKSLTSLRLTNELSDPATDCPITVRMNMIETLIALQPRGAWGDIPSLQVVCSTRTDEGPLSFVFLDAEDRALQLSRPQRQQLLLLLQDKLGDAEQFDPLKSEYELQLPDESVLDACEQLLGEKQDIRLMTATGEEKDAKLAHIFLYREADHFVCATQIEGEAPFVVSFGAQYFGGMQNMATGSRDNMQRTLHLYDMLRKFSRKRD